MVDGDPFAGKKPSKLTRRRIMKLATAAGMSSAVAANLTKADVKAASTDEVTISVDIQGNVKTQMAADRLEWLQRATKATKDVRNRHLKRDGVRGVRMNGGARGDNQHVIVLIDNNHPQKEKRRGEISEKHENGVRIEVEESEDKGGQTCSPETIDSESDPLPGGQQIQTRYEDDGSYNYEPPLTISPRMWYPDGSSCGWGTAAHGLKDCLAKGDIRHTGGGNQAVGEVLIINWDLDFVFIELKGREGGTSNHNQHPEKDYDDVEINGTVSEEGMQTVYDEYQQEEALGFYGIGSCYEDFELMSWNATYRKGSGYDCQTYVYDQFYIRSDYGSVRFQSGDSGGLVHTPDPTGGDYYYAIGSASGYQGSLDGWHNHGPQGFSIDNQSGCQWVN